MKHHLFVIVILTLLLIPVGKAQDDLQDETLLMTFIPNIQFAPMYLSIAEGHFAEAGFDVMLDYLDEPDVVNLVAAENANFGVVSGEQVILAASRERPIVYVYEWFQEFPIGIVHSAEREITNAADLIGLRVGVPGYFGATYSGLTTLLDAEGLSQEDLTLDEIGFFAPDVFCVGAVDASVIYINNEPLQIQNRADMGECGDVQDVDVLAIGEIVDLVSNGIITNQTMIDENSEQVAAFVGAFDAGLRSTINNPARAYLFSAEFIETLPFDEALEAALTELADQQDDFLAENPDREAIAVSRQAMYDALLAEFDAGDLLQFEVLLASIELWDAEQTGYTDAASWENMQQTLLSLGQLDAALVLETVYSNDYLPQDD